MATVTALQPVDPEPSEHSETSPTMRGLGRKPWLKAGTNVRLGSLALGIPFIIMHLVPAAAIWTGVNAVDVVVCFGLYAVRMFGVTAGYHRYFSHRTFKTSRFFQFVLAFLAQTSAQKGALWWAAHHRHHHKHSDEVDDVHSPVQESFFYSHLGWILVDQTGDTDMSRVKDLARYPELVFLNRYHWIPPLVLALAVLFTLGWSGLVIGFFASTLMVYHGTFVINSLAHVWGKRRFETGDESRNNLWLALLTFGEGWHNNHHHYQSSCRQGFYWWEIDLTYYVLKALSAVGLVSDLRVPPSHVLAAGRRTDNATSVAS